MEKIVITVEDGITKFLVNDQTRDLVEDGVVKRASHVEPVNKTLCVVFHVLRGLFGEYGWVASFTRKWPCMWQINLSPIGLSKMPYVYENRQDAIKDEIEYLQKFFI